MARVGLERHRGKIYQKYCTILAALTRVHFIISQRFPPVDDT